MRPPDNGRSALLAPLLAILMVTLAGCAGTGFAAGLTKPGPYTATGAELDGDALRDDHLAGLHDAGSFRGATALSIEGGGAVSRISRHTAVDGDADRSSRTTRVNSSALDGDGLAIDTYTDGNETYRRVTVDAGNQRVTRYDAASAPYDDGALAVTPVNATRAANADVIPSLIDDVDWQQRGVERYGGGWVTRYEASGPENVTGIGPTALDAGRVDDTDGSALPEALDLDVDAVNATLLVAPDGVVRRLHVHVEGNAAGEPVELTLELTADDVGSTTVDPPDWLEDARDATNDSTA